MDERVSPDLGAFVVNFNGGEKVVQCLRALLNQTAPIRELVVVDNGSTDGSVEAIAREVPEARVIALGTNQGLPAARNAALKALSTEFALSVDSDVYLARDCAERMLAARTDPDVAVVCPRVVFFPENTHIQCDGAYIHFIGTLGLRHALRRPEDVVDARRTVVGGCIGACLLMHRTSVLDSGGFHEHFFFYFEDLEFSLRLRARGFRLVCEPAAVVHHDRGEGIPGLSFRGRGEYPDRRAYFSIRHRWLAILLHYRVRTLLVLAPALAAYLVATVVFVIIRRRFGAWARAWGWLLSHIGEIRAMRRPIQQARRVRDRDLLEGGPLPLAPGLFNSRLARAAVRLLELTLNGYWRIVRGIVP